MKKVRVLIVDDSASVRQGLVDIISGEPDLEVMAVAADPLFAAEKIRQQVPDVILCDIEMPRMDGITFVQRIMSQRPMPVVICSSLAEAGSETALRAIEAGAVEVIAKPKLGTRQFIEESRVAICDALRACGRDGRRPWSRPSSPRTRCCRHPAAGPWRARPTKWS